MNKSKNSLGDVKQDPRYHDTKLLLQKYRVVMWGLEVEVARARKSFQAEYGMTVEEYLDSIYVAGVDLPGSKLANRAVEIDQNRQMLDVIDRALELLHEKHPLGEEYYLVLYYTYIQPQRMTVDQVVSVLTPKIRDISRRTYFRKRDQAVAVLGGILWGYSDPETRRLLDEILPHFPVEPGGKS